jgi:multicomponent Na+:H+ antiporter subunit D
MAWLSVAALLIPVFAAAAILAAKRHPRLRDALVVVAALALAACVLGLSPSILAGEAPRVLLVQVAPGLELALAPEPLGLIYALVASLLFVPTAAYALGYARASNLKKPARFHAGFQLAMAAAMGIAFSANLFTLFVFYELMTLVTYPLVAHAETQRAREGARRYLTILLGSSLGLLFAAIAWTFSLAGTLEFAPGGILSHDLPKGVLVLLLALFAWGFGKAALMPLHGWLPSAMVAPTPVSALLHAVAVVKAGVFGITKVVVAIFGLDVLAGLGASDWLVLVAAASLVVSGWIALRQDELKRRLAYSTVSQLAYVTLGAALATSYGAAGAALQIATHAAGKITLFFAAGCIQVASARTKVSQLDGIGRRMPVTMTCFVIASISVIGLPPCAGVISKWYLLRGAAQAESAVAAAAIIIGTLLAIGYLAPIVSAAFFRAEPHSPVERTQEKVQEAPPLMLVAICLTALTTLLLFLFPGTLTELAELAVGMTGDRP